MQELTIDWCNPEEFRNGVGIVLMTDGSYRRDGICTYVYDKESKRGIRWPYVTCGGNSAITDLVEYVDALHP